MTGYPPKKQIKRLLLNNLTGYHSSEQTFFTNVKKVDVKSVFGEKTFLLFYVL